ncbi:MAG: pyrimidine/purine nucleoside phosphorylase [Verrucomicrobia bacterium]|nr:MAG: pyrimidine/purine nucleoside phosphorylase [Verrucomicrobiota bacterium]TAE87525.1 MAG: pyrimidine/purine nucleoside phosphorylase [Verrucomicrobiota bacterium]TAF25805.1 MAG: pyrimidine/purine nucleoside phosphorylase [Verrucomicrobiota bacterium]TAF41593.1 MAG: pyrimidine/purine nucleoside phosphorylase [Verrucomicrobiota bacterium]
MSTLFENVSVATKANVYFDGKVVSHSLTLADGRKKSLGVIFPGEYHFGTGEPEVMEITSGACSVLLDGGSETLEVAAGAAFEVVGNSGFTITVKDVPCEYICSFGQP